MKISVAFAWFIAIFHRSLGIDLSKCGTSVGCLRSPDGCKGDACDVAALWSKGATSDTIHFEITAKGNSYVAIGFSKDTSMGDDSVIDCVNKDNKVFVRPSYNEKNMRSNSELTNLSPADAGLTLTSSSSTGGFVTCKFTRNITVPGHEAEVFDLSAQQYYVMLAYGSLQADGTKNQHASNARMRSKTLVDLLSTKESGGSSAGTARKSVLHKVHGVLMIGAWTVAAAMGMFVARHFKPAWPNTKLLDTKVWFVAVEEDVSSPKKNSRVEQLGKCICDNPGFCCGCDKFGSSFSWYWVYYVWSLFQFHRTLMVLALLCTVAAFIIIFVQVKMYTQFSGGDSDFKQSHPPMGIVITALVIINPIMTFFRCHPGAKYRALFDWAHFSVGMSALILSFINVFSGIKLGGFSDNVMWVMATYIIFYVIMMLVMEAHKCSKGSRPGKSKSMELRSKSSRSSTPPPPPTFAFKYTMLIIFMSVSVGLFSVMLILVVES